MAHSLVYEEIYGVKNIKSLKLYSFRKVHEQNYRGKKDIQKVATKG